MIKANKISMALVTTLVLTLHCGRTNAPTDSSSFKMLDGPSSVVFSTLETDPYDPMNTKGYNHTPSIAALPNGCYLVAWSQGAYEWAFGQRIVAATSCDEGKTWSEPKTLSQVKRKTCIDPAFIVDEKRVFLFYSVGRFQRWPSIQNENEGVGVNSFQVFEIHSDDNGETWSSPRGLIKKWDPRSNGIKLANGKLLLGLHNLLSTELSVLESLDKGLNWQHYAGITSETISIDEPSIVETSANSLLMAIRTNDGFLWTATSQDGGVKWATPQKTSIPASSASHALYKTKNGMKIFLAYNPPPKRQSLVLRVSIDSGQTWSEPMLIAEATAPETPFWDHQVTYPSFAELPNGDLLIPYAHLLFSDDFQSGEILVKRISP